MQYCKQTSWAEKKICSENSCFGNNPQTIGFYTGCLRVWFGKKLLMRHKKNRGGGGGVECVESWRDN